MRILKTSMRWGAICAVFLAIAIADFSTRSEYVWAYLYSLPILISVSFFRPRIAQTVLFFAIVATLLNLLFPQNVLGTPSVVVNRLLAAFSIGVSAFFMVSYIRHQESEKGYTEQLMAERQVSKVREDFVATLTHDLRMPMVGSEKALGYLLDHTFVHIRSQNWSSRSCVLVQMVFVSKVFLQNSCKN